MIFLFNSTVSDSEEFCKFVKSISGFPFSKVIFYYINNTDVNLRATIEENFKGKTIIIEDRLNKTQKDWQKTYDLLDEEFVWVCSKYDSQFVDSDTRHLEDVLKFRKDGGTEKLASINICNWVSNLMKCVIIDHGIWDGEKHPAPTQAWISVDDCDSYQIATKALYKSWFFDQDYGQQEFTSLEELSRKVDFIRPWKIQVPSREILRKSKKISENNLFTRTSLTPDQRKRMLMQYYLSKIPKNLRCLANPRYEKGIFERVLRNYGFNKKDIK
tara:strand:+ start:7482 stop:8297 length:816 start_codon:yes stop_codon:yes gene_type:complete